MGNNINYSIDKLKKAFNEKNLTLYLGAGVSIESNLPSWEKLVLAMYFAKISEQEMQGWRPFPNYLFAIAEWHLANSAEPLEITARKLLKYYGDKKMADSLFLEDLHRTLYGGYLNEGDNLIRPIEKSFLRNYNSTLSAISKLCEQNYRGIKSVITYNYDNLLEISLDNFNYQTIFGLTELDPSKLPIYHVHGYVPLDKKIRGSKGNEIVFTEYQYHKIAEDPYNWSNLVQLQTMSNSVGLMVGLSLSDRNMRRLLDAVRNAPIQSTNFALLEEPDTSPPSDEVLDKINDKAISYLSKFENSGIKSELPGFSIYSQPRGIKSAKPSVKSSRSGEKGPRYREEIAGIIEQVKRLDKEQMEYVLEQLGVQPIWYKDVLDIQVIIDQII
jgi:hypothetical protein